MEKLKYDSLYKFIVSIGIVIMILPFGFIFGILNKNDTVLVSQNEINQLTNTAKEIIYLEQDYKYLILSKPILFSTITMILFLIGSVIVIYGIIQWKDKVQKYEDKSRELSNKLLEKQIKSLTLEEKEEKIKEDIEEEKIEIKAKNSNVMIHKQRIDKYMDIQETVYRSIRKQFNNYKIFEEVKLENQIYDCIALDNSEYALHDYIFEIKYFSSIKSIKGKIKSLESKMLEKEMLYYENSKRYARTVLIIVVDNFDDKDKLENKKLLDEINERNRYLSKIIVTGIKGIDDELRKIKNI